MQPLPARTQRLQLEFFEEGDAAFVMTMLNDPAFIEFIGDRNVRSIPDAIEYINVRFINHYKLNGFTMYKVVHLQSGLPIGMCGLVNRPGLEDVDLGFAFLPEYRSKGFAFEASETVVQFARNELGMNKLASITLEKNEASIILLEKLGFTFDKMVQIPSDSESLMQFILELD